MSKSLCAACILLWIAVAAGSATAGEETLPRVGDHSLRILSSTVLELISITTKDPDPARVTSWDLVNTSSQFVWPIPADFQVTANGQPGGVQSVIGFKRRPVY